MAIYREKYIERPDAAEAAARLKEGREAQAGSDYRTIRARRDELIKSGEITPDETGAHSLKPTKEA